MALAQQRATTQTTGATAATLISYTPPDGTLTRVRVVVLADVAAGGTSAWYARTAVFRRAGASVTLVGGVASEVTIEDAGATTWDTTLDASGSTIRLRVTGAALTTIDWAGTLTAFRA